MLTVPSSFLVTGGAGFIGSHLVDALVEQGHDVVVLDNLSTGRLRNLRSARRSPHFRFVQGSVLDALLVDELVGEVDCIVHLAAAVGVKLIIEQPLRSFITNIRGTELVLDAAHRYRRKVFLASTSEVYGKNNADALDESADRLMGSTSIARWAYSTAKSVDEVLAFAYHKERGLDVVIARFFNTVGPRQTAAYGMVIPTLVDQAVAGKPLTVHGTGQQTRCFCHVQDTVQGVLRLLDDDRASGDVFNVGSSDEITISDLAVRIVETAESESPIRLVPYAEVYENDFEDMLRRVPTRASCACGHRLAAHEDTHRHPRGERQGSPDRGQRHHCEAPVGVLLPPCRSTRSTVPTPCASRSPVCSRSSSCSQPCPWSVASHSREASLTGRAARGISVRPPTSAERHCCSACSARPRSSRNGMLRS